MANSNAQQKNSVGYYDQAEVVPRAKRVRKINNDFEYLNQGDLPAHASNDEIFNASYKTRGLQPQSLDKIEPKEAVNDENYNNQVIDEQIRRNRNQVLRQIAQKKASQKMVRVALKSRVSAVNLSIFAWGSTVYLVQLIFGLISLVMLGVTAVAYGIINSSGLGSALSWLASAAQAGIKFVAGIDINLAASADGLFFIPYIIVMVLGLITLFTAWLQYTMALLKPLSGEKSGLKLGLFMLAYICYNVPILNIFPWALPWMLVVWKYPR